MSRTSKPNRLAIEKLEARLCPVLGAFDIPAIVQPGTGYDGVARVSNATGALLSTARHVLTAAHVPGGSTPEAQFTRVGIDTPTAKVNIHPQYGIHADDYDIAVMELAELAPLTMDRYDIYTATDEKGKVATIAGYGRTGTGTNGDSTDLTSGNQFNRELVRFTITGNPTGGFFFPRLSDEIPPVQPAVPYNTNAGLLKVALESLPGIISVQVRLVGDIDFDGVVENVSHPYAGSFEALFISTDIANHDIADVIVTDNFTGAGNPGVTVKTLLQGGTLRDLRSGRNLVGNYDRNGSRLVADFDDGTDEGSPLDDGLGQGALEGFGSAGDSGSPVFINGKIAGVHEQRELVGHDGIDNNSDFGERNSWVRVSFHQDFINGILDDPFALVLDMDNQIRAGGVASKITVSRSGDDFRIQFGNSVVYTEWLGRIQSITIRGSDDAETIIVSNLNVGVPVVVQGGGGDDTIIVNGKTPLNLTIDGQSGQDAIDLQAVGAAASFSVLGSSGNDELKIGAGILDVNVQGNVTVNGAALNVVLLDTSAVGNNDYNLTGAWFDKPTMLGKVSFTSAQSVTLNTNNSSSAVFVQQTALNIDYFINTGAVADAITVGVGNIANDIRGDLTINAGSGSDTLTFNDLSSNIAGRTHSLTSTTYNQSSLVSAISFTAVNRIVMEQNDLSATINVSTTLSGIAFDIRGHGGNDTILLTAPPIASVDIDGGTGIDTVDLIGGAGVDFVTVNGSTVVFAGGSIALANIELLNLSGQGGNDTINIDSVPLGRTVTVTGVNGADQLNIGNGDLDAAIVGIVNATGNQINARLLDNKAVGDDDYTFTATMFTKPTMLGSVTFTSVASVTLEPSIGSNQITIEQTAAGTKYFINAGVLHDEITVGKGNILANIAGSLTIDGGGGYDFVTLQDAATVVVNQSHTLTSTGYSQIGLAPTISFSLVDQVELEQNNKAAAINVKSTDPAVILTADGNGGGDTFAIDGAPAGTVRLNGASPTDSAQLTGSSGADTITWTGKSFQYAGAGSVELSAISVVNVDALGGTDVLAYNGTVGTVDTVSLFGSSNKGAGKLSAGGISVNFVAMEGLDALGNAGDADELTFHGTAIVDRFSVNLAANGSAADPVVMFQSNAGAELLRLADYRDFSTRLRGEAGNDVFHVSMGPVSPRNRNIEIIGGSGRNRLVLNYAAPAPSVTHQSLGSNQGQYTVVYPARTYRVAYNEISSLPFVDVSKYDDDQV